MEKIPERKIPKKEIKKLESFEKEVEYLRVENQVLKQELEEREQQIKTLKEKEDVDFLTGLLNRESFKKRAEKIVEGIHFLDKFPERRKERIKGMSLLFIDVDDFKKINDTYGHNMGDEVLKIVGGWVRL